MTEIEYLKQENKKLVKALDDYGNKNFNYKQALEEIREIAKFNQFYNPEYFMLRGDIGQIQNIKMTEVYEKCNEALNDRD